MHALCSNVVLSLVVLLTRGRTTTWEEMPRIRWATIKPLGSKEVVVTITLLINELFILVLLTRDIWCGNVDGGDK